MRKSFLAEVNPESIDIKSVSSRVKNKLEQIKSYNSSLKQSQGGDNNASLADSFNERKDSRLLNRSSLKNNVVREPRAKDNAFNRKMNEQVASLKSKVSSGRVGKKIDLQDVLNKVNNYRDTLTKVKEAKEYSEHLPKEKPKQRTKTNLKSKSSLYKKPSLKEEHSTKKSARHTGDAKSSYKTKYKKYSRNRSASSSSLKDSKLSSYLGNDSIKRERRNKRPVRNREFTERHSVLPHVYAKPKKESGLQKVLGDTIKDKIIKSLQLKTETASPLESVPSSYNTYKQESKDTIKNSDKLDTINMNEVAVSSSDSSIQKLEKKVQQLLDFQKSFNKDKKEPTLDNKDKKENILQVASNVNDMPGIGNIANKNINALPDNYQSSVNVNEVNSKKVPYNKPLVAGNNIHYGIENKQANAIDYHRNQEHIHSHNDRTKVPHKNNKQFVANEKAYNHRENSYFEDSYYEPEEEYQDNYSAQYVDVHTDGSKNDVSKDVLITMLQSLLNKNNSEQGQSKNLENLIQQLINTVQNTNKKESLSDVLVAQLVAKNNDTHSKSTDMILSKLLDNALAGNKNNNSDAVLSGLISKLENITGSNKYFASGDSSLNVEIAKISSHLENDRHNQNQKYLQDILHEVKSSKNNSVSSLEDIERKYSRLEKTNIDYIEQLESRVKSIKTSLEEKLLDLQNGFNINKINSSLKDLEGSISSSLIGKVGEVIDEKIDNFGSNIQHLKSNLEEKQILTQEDVDNKLDSIESYITSKLNNSESKIDQSLEDNKKLLERQEQIVEKVLSNESSFIESMQAILEKLDNRKQNVDLHKEQGLLAKDDSLKHTQQESKSLAKKTQVDLINNLNKISEVSKHLEKMKKNHKHSDTKKQQQVENKDSDTNKTKQNLEVKKTESKNLSLSVKESGDKKQREENDNKDTSYDTKEVFSFLNKPYAKKESSKEPLETEKKEQKKQANEEKTNTEDEYIIKGDVIVPDYIPLSGSSSSGKAIKAVWSDDNVEEELKHKWRGAKEE